MDIKPNTNPTCKFHTPSVSVTHNLFITFLIAQKFVGFSLKVNIPFYIITYKHHINMFALQNMNTQNKPTHLEKWVHFQVNDRNVISLTLDTKIDVPCIEPRWASFYSKRRVLNKSLTECDNFWRFLFFSSHSTRRNREMPWLIFFTNSLSIWQD